jgi:hypothetical protein
MNKIGKLIIGVVAALVIATSAFAADTAVKASTNAPVAVTTVATNSFTSDWVFTLGGAGATTTSGDSQSAFGLNLSAGKTLSLFNVSGITEEAGVRQSIGYASPNGGTTTLSTKPYLDVNLYTFNLTKTVPVTLFAGGNAGLTYGNSPLRWTAAPEAGLDVWLARNVAIEGRGEYAFDLNPSAKAQNAIGWFVGVKFKF